jgi:hypothetical protein
MRASLLGVAVAGLQPVGPSPRDQMEEQPPPAVPSPSSPNKAAPVFAILAVVLVAVVALALKSGRGSILQRHAALIGAVLGFGAGFAGCNGGFTLTDNRPLAFTVPLLAGAIGSLPGLAVGFLRFATDCLTWVSRRSPWLTWSTYRWTRHATGASSGRSRGERSAGEWTFPSARGRGHGGRQVVVPEGPVMHVPP